MNKWLTILLGVSIAAAGHAQDSSVKQTAQRSQYSSGYSEERGDPYGYGYERKPRSAPSSGSYGSHHGDSSSEQQGKKQASHLSDQEEKFARWLSPVHQRVFTEVFTPSMRASAMKLASFRFYDMDGPASSISPDQSVEILMSKFRHHTGQSKDANGRRGCINPNKTPYKQYGGSSHYDEPRSSRGPRVSPYGN